jgi:hypothetical protein
MSWRMFPAPLRGFRAARSAAESRPGEPGRGCRNSRAPATGSRAGRTRRPFPRLPPPASPGVRTAGIIREEKSRRDGERHRHLVKPAGRDADRSRFVFLHRLEGDADAPGQRALAQAQLGAAQADAAADMAIDRMGRFRRIIPGFQLTQNLDLSLSFRRTRNGNRRPWARFPRLELVIPFARLRLLPFAAAFWRRRRRRSRPSGADTRSPSLPAMLLLSHLRAG